MSRTPPWALKLTLPSKAVSVPCVAVSYVPLPLPNVKIPFPAAWVAPSLTVIVPAPPMYRRNDSLKPQSRVPSVSSMTDAGAAAGAASCGREGGEGERRPEGGGRGDRRGEGDGSAAC